MMRPLVLTGVFDRPAQAWLQVLRDTHFPPERNLVPAHLTLFHALPGSDVDAVHTVLAETCADRSQCSATFQAWRFTGQGVALDVASPDLVALRASLASRWRHVLTAQDRQRWNPHVTIQNKVLPEQARTLHAALSGTATPGQVAVVGLVLWRYIGGPWEKIRCFPMPAA